MNTTVMTEQEIPHVVKDVELSVTATRSFSPTIWSDLVQTDVVKSRNNDTEQDEIPCVSSNVIAEKNTTGLQYRA